MPFVVPSQRLAHADRSVIAFSYCSWLYFCFAAPHSTRAFVHAYIEETRGDVGALANLRKRISERDGARLDEVFLAREWAAMSELGPAKIFEDFLRRLWKDAVLRRLGEMPMRGDEALERRRLQLSMLSRKFQKTPWRIVSALMLPSSLV